MKHHTKYKKYHASQKGGQPPTQGQGSPLAFHTEWLLVLQKAFQVMEEVFQRNVHRDYPRLPFAQELLAQVKQKVAAILSSPEETIVFNGNEQVIIHACIQVYAVDLLCTQETPERNYLLAICRRMAARLQSVQAPSMKLHD